jgi:uncharacterized protein
MAQPNVAEEYAHAVNSYRKSKDEFFRSDPHSPIPEDERESFEGLHYFPPDIAMRLVAKVERLPDSDYLKIATTDGNTRLFMRYALLQFRQADQQLQLTAYRAADDETIDDDGNAGVVLFVPFCDTLAGHETYGAGRYLDVEEEPAEDGSGAIVVLDFNLAYNPYCAYNEGYSCPVTPRENYLPVPVRAGERIYHQ